MKKRIIQAAAFFAVVAVIAVGGYFARGLLSGPHSSNVVSLTPANYEQVIKDTTTPLYIEFCGKSYPGCSKQDEVISAAADQYKGKVSFARVNLDDNPELVQELLGVSADKVGKFPVHLLVAPHGDSVLAATGGSLNGEQVGNLVQGGLDQIAAQEQKLIHVISISDLAKIIQNGSKDPTLIEICAVSDGSCMSEASALAHVALSNKGKVTVDLFVVESAQTAQEQQLLQQVAMALALQDVPDFLFVYDKYGAIEGQLDTNQLTAFVGQGLASNGQPPIQTQQDTPQATPQAKP